MKNQKRYLIWVSFDLGVGGDYEGMYRWLDNHKAKECGDNCATLHYSSKANLLAELKKDLKGSVRLNEKRNRVYVVYREDSKIKGAFVIGRRRQAPWTGYGVLEEEAVDEE